MPKKDKKSTQKKNVTVEETRRYAPKVKIDLPFDSAVSGLLQVDPKDVKKPKTK